jgi:hypothetical protein
MYDLAPPLDPEEPLLVGRRLGLFLPPLVWSTLLSDLPLSTFIIQSDRPVRRRLYARRTSIRPFKAQPHRGLLPDGRNVLLCHMVRSDFHPLLYHPYRPRSRQAETLDVVGRSIRWRYWLFPRPAFLDLRDHAQRLEKQAQSTMPSSQAGRHLPTRVYVSLSIHVVFAPLT